MAPIGLIFGEEVGPRYLMLNHTQNRIFQLKCAEGESYNGQKWPFLPKNGVQKLLYISRMAAAMENLIRFSERT